MQLLVKRIGVNKFLKLSNTWEVWKTGKKLNANTTILI